ncbi:hypothetical protein B296_00015979 [Ensete ventricosum]|uniref:DUF3741 domain-containing protein n=1 Tax=Ensete ventricosum TaxID=4639 RepID=A0A426ZRA1_ENSVE|nr:hypothetical protein B296_00015979 [Ensete ventricosum]
MGATGRSYLRSLLPLWLTIPLYSSTSSVVLAVRRELCPLQLWRVGPTHVRLTVQLLAPPCLCQVGFTVAGTNLGDLAEGANSGTNLGDLTGRENSGTNLGDLAERVNSSTNLGDLTGKANSGTNLRNLAKRVNSGTNLGDLTKKVNSGINLSDLAERANSGTTLCDLVERANSGTSLCDLAERANSDTHLCDLAERANSGTNLCDLAERANSGTKLCDLAERANSSTNLCNLAERANFGINLYDLTERVNRAQVRMTSSDSSSSIRIVHSSRSGGTGLGEPEASSSGASSRPPSSVNARVLRDLEVMKADNDLDTTVTEGSLAAIREWYSILAEYRLHVPWSGQRPYGHGVLGWSAHPIGNVPSYPSEEESVLVSRLKGIFSSSCAIKKMTELWLVEAGLSPASRDRMDLGDLHGMPKVSEGKTPSVHAAVLAREVGVSLAREAPKTSSKRPTDTSTEQIDDLTRRHKKVKILSRSHKSRHGEGGSRSHSKGKELVAPVEEPETLVESTEEDASLVFHRPRSMKDLFKTKIDALKSGGGLEAVAASEEHASELEKELEKTKRERDEKLLKEARVRAQKMDDELLQSPKALESARAELPRDKRLMTTRSQSASRKV